MVLTQRSDDAVDGVDNSVCRHQVSVGHGDFVDVNRVVTLRDKERRQAR